MHPHSTSTHSLAGILLDGAVCNCNAPPAVHTQDAHCGEAVAASSSAFLVSSVGLGRGAGEACGKTQHAHFGTNVANDAHFTLYVSASWGSRLREATPWEITLKFFANMLHPLWHCPLEPSYCSTKLAFHYIETVAKLTSLY